MYVFLTVLILICAVLLGLIVLVQNSKGGGLAANFSAQNQIMGVRRTADFLEKATWTLVIVFLALSMLCIFAIPKKTTGNAVQTELTVDDVAIPAAVPQQPVQQAPAQQEQPAQPAQ